MRDRAGYLCRTDKGRGSGRPSVKEKAEEQSKTEDVIVCRKCSHAITTKKEEIAMGGSHIHTFFNPSGIVFELGCFRKSPGSRIVGEATAQFTWFAGYSWNFALCGNCSTHLGWFYQNRDSSFWGLILANLAF